MEDHLRYEEWVKVSLTTAQFDKHFMSLIQQLGRIDTKLVEEDKEYLAKPKDKRETDDELGDRITLSYLWVIGTYESIRTMAQRIKDRSAAVSEDLENQFYLVRDYFNRIRVPLAKMEPSKKHKDTDSHIAYPGVHKEYGISWKLNEDTIITRIELSDMFLDLLKKARIEKIQENINNLNQSDN